MFGTVLKLLLLKNLKTTFRQRKLLITEIILLFVIVPGFIALIVLSTKIDVLKKIGSEVESGSDVSTTENANSTNVTHQPLQEFSTASEIFDETTSTIASTSAEATSTILVEFSSVSNFISTVTTTPSTTSTTSQPLNESSIIDEIEAEMHLQFQDEGFIYMRINFSSNVIVEERIKFLGDFKFACHYKIHVIKLNESILPNITVEINEMNLDDPSFKYKIILHDRNDVGWHNEPHMIPDLFGYSISPIPPSFSQSKSAYYGQICLDYAFFLSSLKTLIIPPPFFNITELVEPCDMEKALLLEIIVLIMELLVPIVISIPAVITVHGLCEEKENNIHTFMVVMGLDRSLFILSHLIFALIKMYIYILPIGITVIICFDEIGWYIFLLIFLYSHVFISIIFLISSLTRKTTVVALIIFGLVLFSLLLQLICKWTIFDITTASILSFILPSFAFKYGLHHLTKIVIFNQEINFFAAPMYMPLCYPIFGLLFQAIFLLILAFYFDAVIPIDDSPKKHPLFFVGMKYDNVSESVKETQLQSLILEGSQQSQRNNEYFENDKTEMHADIDVFHVSKKWSNGRYGIQDITFKAYPNQVTALLGHNGAGKSTTFSILSGFTKSTCGKAYVCGQEPRTLCETSVVGYCPQWDPLFPHLNVREHLQFYQSLKSESNYEEVEGMIQKLGLMDVVNYRSKFLNAGMKRKLCVGMAMIGNSKVIILDEPTHGMDTLSRKQLIEIIRAAKSDHTILLATHYMDEADVISDRIIILSNGSIICNGSSNFLKEKVGTGFLLTVDFTNALGPESYPGFAEAVVTIVSKNCKEAKIHGHIHQQFTIFLPNGTQRLFPAIFSDLETQKDALQINTFDIHKSTLEEVFIKVTDEYEPNQQRHSNEIIKDINEKSAETYTSFGLFMFQLFALFIRKWHYTRRHYIRFAIPYVIIVMFLAYYFYVQHGDNEKYWQKDESTAIGDYSDITVFLIEVNSNWYASSKNLFPKTINLIWHNVKKDNHSFTDDLFYKEHPLAFVIELGINNTVQIDYRSSFPNGVPIALNTLANSLFERKNVIKTTISIAGNDKIIYSPLNIRSLQLFFVAIFPLVFMVLINLHVEEINYGIVHLYQRTHMSLFSYWLASFIFDFTYAIIPILIEVITILIAGNDILLKSECWHIIVIGILLLALMFLLQSYVFSTFFKSSTLAVIMFLVYNVLMFDFAFDVLDVINAIYGKNILVYVSMVFPLASLLLLIESTDKSCGCDDIFVFCNGDTVNSTCYGEFFLTVFLNIIFNLIGLIIWSFRRSIFSCQSSPSDLTPYKENADVLEEKRKVEKLGPNAFQIYSLNLRKMYSGLVAVRDITMGVAHYECFGLLGANGAGKSTFFNMLTASMKPSCGTGYVGGIDIRKQPLFGFCPQIPRFLPELSVEETVYFFIRLKGYVIRTELAEIVIESFYLRNIKDTRVGNLTGGELRRLSIAIALITNSDIIMLDEPTTGVDPRTRRHIWELLIAFRTIGSSQLLTSHSMEECEALCTKIGFINHGVFIGIGTSQHLKNRFGNTHRLTIILNSPNAVVAEKLNFEIQAIFKATAISVSGNVPDLIWSIPKTSESLSQLYSRLIQFIDAQPKESNGSENPIKDFSIVGTSLEEVFATMVDTKIQYEFRF